MRAEDSDTMMQLTEYALGALESTEKADVEALLARSEEARAELRSLRAALVGLTETLPPVAPPAHVWEGLQARLEVASSSALPSTVVSLPRTRPWQGYLGWALAACLALVAVSEGLWLQTTRTAYREAERKAYLVANFLGAPTVERVPLYGRAREGIGSVLTRPDGKALFVLGEAPSAGRNYQAWGHTSDNWTPGSSDRLTSLGVSDDTVFEVATGPFAALYLSLEPVGGSPQPTYPLSRVSLTEPAVSAPLSIVSPKDGAAIDSASVIVSGTVDATITSLSYVLNGEARETTTSGARFSFTATLQRGANTLVVRARGAKGVTERTLTLTRP